MPLYETQMIGTAVFAATGVLAVTRRELDLFGAGLFGVQATERVLMTVVVSGAIVTAIPSPSTLTAGKNVRQNDPSVPGRA